MKTSSALEGLIGNTPLVKLSNLLPSARRNIYAKLEMYNPGGSMKDRAAWSIVRMALKDGTVSVGGTVIESSSGNMGIGLAQACHYFGLRFICIVDERANEQNIKTIQALGATVEIVRSTPKHPDLLAARIHRVQELCQTIPGSYWPNQYKNLHAAQAYHAMVEEVVKTLAGKSIDYLFCATGTCGTLRGCADYIAKHKLRTKIIAVDAVGSAIFGGKPGKRLLPGHGAAIQPELFQPDLAQDVVYATDADCIKGCRLLLERESLLTGGSSGAIAIALTKYLEHIPENANIILILPDRGDRYLDTIYNPAWVSQMKLEERNI